VAIAVRATEAVDLNFDIKCGKIKTWVGFYLVPNTLVFGVIILFDGLLEQPGALI